MFARPPLWLIVLAGAAGACGGGGFALSVGDCVRIDGPADPVSGLGDVTIVPCDEPHHLEVFHTFDLAPDQVAGTDRVDAIVAACLGDAFGDYTGVASDDSPLELFPIPPTPADVERGDREVVCTVRPPGGGTTTGSVRDR